MSKRTYHKFFAEVSDTGKLQYANPELLNSMLNSLRGKKVEVVIKPVTKRTSLSQHGYYRGVILEACFASEMFSHYDTPDDIHEDYFAPKFLKYIKLITWPEGKKEIVCYKSMADMSEAETSEFIERVKLDCEMNGIEVKSPEEYWSKYHK